MSDMGKRKATPSHSFPTKSMCRHSYEARWRHTNDHCPNLVPNEFDKGREPGEGTMGLRVKFATKHFKDDSNFDRKRKTFVNLTECAAGRALANGVFP